jgi:hypothetical protein
MNVETWTEAEQFLFWEYINGIFIVVRVEANLRRQQRYEQSGENTEVGVMEGGLPIRSTHTAISTPYLWHSTCKRRQRKRRCPRTWQTVYDHGAPATAAAAAATAAAAAAADVVTGRKTTGVVAVAANGDSSLPYSNPRDKASEAFKQYFLCMW